MVFDDFILWLDVDICINELRMQKKDRNTLPQSSIAHEQETNRVGAVGEAVGSGGCWVRVRVFK